MANHNGINYCIWPAAMIQGRIAGVNLASAGNIDADQQLEAIISATDSNYKKLVLENDQIVGCIMLGDVGQFQQITNHIREKTKRGDIPPKLLTTA